MKLGALYQLTIDLAMEADMRGLAAMKAALTHAKKEHDELNEKKKPYFDKEQLQNPYGDTRILYGDRNLDVKHLMVGIDIDTSELLVADRLRANGKKIDAVMAHHPEGVALVNLTRVMDIQEDIMHHYGVPLNIINKLMDKRIAELNRGLHPINHDKAVDAARHLDIPFLVTHTVADNMVHRFITDMVRTNEKKLATLKDLMNMFEDLPEFQHARKMGSGPMIVAGSPRSKTGKIAVTDMTGGTSGAKETYEQLSRAGVGTILGMHMKEDYRQEAEKHMLNVILTGHMASDSIGMNLLVDQIEASGVEIIPTSGFIRVKRPTKTKKG